LSANVVDRPVPCGRDQPADGIVRLPVAWPAFGSDRERLLRGILGKLDVAEDPHEGGQHPGPVLAEDPRQAPWNNASRTGRTSIAPLVRVPCSSCAMGERSVEVVGLDHNDAR